LALGCGTALHAITPESEQVVVIFNRQAAGSEEIARHYAEARGVPAANVLGFAMDDTETINWTQFVGEIWQPIQDRLIQRGWIDAYSTAGTDAVGRKIYRIVGHHIRAMVLCRGVPLRVANDPKLIVEDPFFNRHPELRTNAGSVDSELSLLAAGSGYPINGMVPNRLFNKQQPSPQDLLQVVKISRLDGPTVAQANALVDQALYAERWGLMGRAYIDMGGRYPDGDHWLQAVADTVEGEGFSTDVDRDPNTLPPWVRIDAPVIYFGWYTGDVNGPFLLPGFHFPPGAIAFHLHSFSAATLRSDTSNWCGPLLARGAAATVGNVWEPYLQFTHRPDLLMKALVRGAAWVDAVYTALPALSWAPVAIGDPLYRPFAVGWDRQTERFNELPEPWGAYTALRLARIMEKTGQPEQVLPILRSALKLRPNLALGLALARRLQASGQPGPAGQVLRPLLSAPVRAPDEWGTLAEAAQLALDCGQPQWAESAYRRLLHEPGLPLALSAHWLVDARQAALRANDPAQAEAWKHELDHDVAQLRK
jgi:uncharacterized protein (TIGR03790 family)